MSEQTTQDATGPEADPVTDTAIDVTDTAIDDRDAPEALDAPGGEGDDAESPVAGAAEPTPQDETPVEGDGDRVKRLEAEGDIAADYLEELLDIADLDGDLDMDVEGDRAAVSIVGADLSQLVGGRGEVLDALQELTRLAVYRETGERSRLMLDISGFRADRRTQLLALAEQTASEVRSTNQAVSLDAMSPFERKVVHDAIAAAGLRSESEGSEPRRYVVVLPA